MIGDKLLIEPHHTQRAEEICALLTQQPLNRFVLTVAGESGSGKSELAQEIARCLSKRNIPTGVLQQDDYFVFPPKTNHRMRQNNIEQVGPHEVKLDFMDSNLRSFKRGETPIYKPLVIYEEDRATTEELDTSGFRVLIAEGTYASLLSFADFRVFIDRDYHQTLAARQKRARDRFDAFIQDVLAREHEIISEHKALADVVISSEFDRVLVSQR